MKTLEEQIVEFDANPGMHYYVYFSSNTYQYKVDVIHFESFDKIKSKYYASLTYYDTYAEAKAKADEMNKNDSDVRHLICRAIKVFLDSTQEIIETSNKELSPVSRRAINVLRNMGEFVQELLSVKEE